MSNRYAELDDRKDDLRELLRAYPKIGAEFERRYEMSWIYHENALEGLVLSEQELLQALEIQVVADATLMQIVTTIRNHRAALDLVKAEAAGKKLRLSLNFVKALYEIFERGAPEGGKGPLRKEMPLHRTYYHDIAQPARIQQDLQKLVEFTSTAEFKEFHPIKQGSYVHWQFMQIFPFVDHNGRIARLLQNMYLLRASYPPGIIHAIDRQKYYDALRLPLTTLRTLLLEAVENSIANAEKFVQAERAKARKAASQ